MSLQSVHREGNMTPDFADTRTLRRQLKTAGCEFLASIRHLEDDHDPYNNLEADHYWSQLRRDASRNFHEITI